MALRTSDSTTTIFVKAVHSSSTDGATPSRVTSRMIVTTWLGWPGTLTLTWPLVAVDAPVPARVAGVAGAVGRAGPRGSAGAAIGARDRAADGADAVSAAPAARVGAASAAVPVPTSSSRANAVPASSPNACLALADRGAGRVTG